MAEASEDAGQVSLSVPVPADPLAPRSEASGAALAEASEDAGQVSLSVPVPTDLLAPRSEASGAALAEAAGQSPSISEEHTWAGAINRSVEEVDAIPGDKLHGDIHEEEDTLLDTDGEVIEQVVKGSIRLHNPSARDRLWDLDIFLAGLDDTDLGEDHILISELEAGAEHTVEYTVSGSRMLVLRERIDTNPARPQERSLSVVLDDAPTEAELVLKVENAAQVALTDVAVTREIPSQLHITDHEGSHLEGGRLIWEVGELARGASQELRLSLEIKSDGTAPIAAGAAEATYEATSTLSSLHMRELDALCRGFSYMNVDEDERPDNWQCQAVFENRSSFVVDLVKLQVRMAGAEGLLFDVKDVPEDVLPNARWESDLRTVESEHRPNFQQELGYTVLPRAQRSTSGRVRLQEQSIPVLDATLEKSYDETVLRSYREQDFNVELDIKNTGSANINLMRIIDDVPGMFASPDLDAMRISVGGTELASDQFRSETQQGIKLEERRVSPDGDGFHLTITIGTRGPIGLAPGETMTIRYPLSAPDPSPDNHEVAAPAKADFSMERFGPVCARVVQSAPVLSVSHKRRKFSTGKEVFPAGGAGRYEVLIMFENRSDSPLSDLALQDVLPHAFEMLSNRVTSSNAGELEVTPTETAGDEQTSYEWVIPLIVVGERIEVSYEIKGDPEAEFKVQEASVFHGASGGTELDDGTPTPRPEPAADDDEDDDGAAMLVAETDGSMVSESEDEGAEVETEIVVHTPDEAAGDADDAEADASPVEEPAEPEALEDRTCPICGAGNPPGASFCGTCSFHFPDA